MSISLLALIFGNKITVFLNNLHQQTAVLNFFSTFAPSFQDNRQQ